jgi:Mce-associated membrane protein
VTEVRLDDSGSPSPDEDAPSTSVERKEGKAKKKGGKGRKARRRRRLLMVIAALAALCALLVAAVVLLTVRLVHDRHLDTARTSALRSAQDAMRDFATFSYRTADADFARTASDITGSFKTTYTNTSSALKATVVKNQMVATVQIVNAGVKSISPHHAVVVVLLDQTVRQSGSTTPVLNRDRATVTMIRKGSGRWLISQIDLD